ncbi:MAG: DUF3572 family protein [Rhizobiales bacterium]|nr:DUF3572 domain-containing protein [Hyphomicrobiales bacterium]NRB14775.1 DUF3572 family protein [Hyphomicrobiales bacterium]
MNLHQAENTVIAAVQYLSANEGYFANFLGYTGSTPDQLNEAIHTINFQISVLDFICLDEPLLLSFCLHAQIDPTIPYNAFQFLSHQSYN